MEKSIQKYVESLEEFIKEITDKLKLSQTLEVAKFKGEIQNIAKSLALFIEEMANANANLGSTLKKFKV